MKYRYPGIRSFTREDEALFFGRKNDEERLYKLIRLEKLAVLYGKSGYGKSSLLQAKIIPRLESETDFVAIPVRFYGFNANFEAQLSPIQRTVEALKACWNKLQIPIGGNSWVDRLIPEEGSLWYHFKKLQTDSRRHRFVLVFDQFEEIFTYPEQAILQFRAQLADLLFVQIPQSFRNVYDNSPVVESMSDEDISLFFEDLDVRVMFSIRSDYMHLMNRLKDYLPQVLRHCYELDALSIEQAKEAIVGPAQLSVPVGETDSTPSFQYSPEALQLLLNFLGKEGKEKIESFQLQLICRHIEERFVMQMGKTRIEEADFGTYYEERLHYLSDVNRNYYQDCISKLPLEKQEVARLIVEAELVTPEDKRRITADGGMLVSRYKVRGADSVLLEALKDTYLLRAEATPRGTAYELSHDALVEPILRARAEREQIEARELANKKRRRVIFLAIGSFLIAFLSLGAMFYALNQQQKAREAQLEALSERDKANLALQNFKKEQEAKDRLQFDELYRRAEDILEGGGCPATILQEMKSIANQYSENQTFIKRISAILKRSQTISIDCQ